MDTPASPKTTRRFPGLPQLIRKSWKLFVILPMGTSLLGALYTFLLVPRVFEARAFIIIQRLKIESELEPKIQMAERDPEPSGRQKALFSLVKSPRVAAEAYPGVRNVLTRKPATQEELLRRIQPRLDGDILSIAVEDENALSSTTAANLWAGAYVEEMNRMYSQGALCQVQLLRSQATSALETFRKTQEALEQFLANNRIEELDRMLTALRTTLDSHVESLHRIQALTQDAQSLRTRILEEKGSGIPATVASNTLSWMFLRTSAALLASHGKSSGPLEFPRGVTDGKNLDQQPSMAELDKFIAGLANMEQSIRELIAKGDFDKQVSRLTADLEKERSRKRETIQHRDIKWDLYSALSRKITDLEVGLENRYVSLVDAVPPTEPNSLHAGIRIGAAAALGLILALAAAFLKERPH